MIVNSVNVKFGTVGRRGVIYIGVYMYHTEERSRTLEPKGFCVVLVKLHHNHLQGLLKFIAGPIHGVSDSAGLGWGIRNANF